MTEIVFGREVKPLNLLAEDDPWIPDEQLFTFLSTPGAQEIAEYVWDTTVPGWDEPWPQAEMPLSIRQAMEWVVGNSDVTGRLYELRHLKEVLDNEDTANYAVLDKCRYCETYGCTDKWCGLRGDDQ